MNTNAYESQKCQLPLESPDIVYLELNLGSLIVSPGTISLHPHTQPLIFLNANEEGHIPLTSEVSCGNH